MSKPTFTADAPASRAARIFTAAAVALAVWIILSTINVIRTGWIAIPIADDWDRWITLARDHYTPAWFYAEHVDHRLVVARLFFTVDHLVFEGRGWFLLICSCAIQVTTGFLLWSLAGRAYRQDRTERVMQAATVLCCVLSAQQWHNLIWPFQVQFPLVYCASAAALFALWKSAERNWDPRLLAASIGLAVVATYSMANGILVWLVMLIAAAWLGMPRKWMGAVAAGWLLVAVAYFYQWQPFQTPGYKLPLAERFPRAVLFWVGHLGSPFSPLTTLFNSELSKVLLAAIPGALLALTLLAGFVLLWFRRQKFPNARAMLVFYSMFLAGSSAVMAYGRSGGSPLVLYEPRYLTPSYLFWVSMLLWTWPFFLRLRRRSVFYGVICAAILLGIAIHQRAVLIGIRDRQEIQKLGELAVVDNVTDPDPWLYLFHTPAMAESAIDYLKKNRLTVFTEEWTHWPGLPLKRRFSIDGTPGACQGGFDQVTAIASTLHAGWRATGWAWDNRAKASPRYIILADESGLIAGVALTGFRVPAELAALSQNQVASTWNGYISGLARPVTAYLLEADGRSLCAIGTQRLHRAGGEVPFTDLGGLLPLSAPEISGVMTLNGYFKGNGGPGVPPVDGPIYGSFPDSEKGSLRLGPFHLDGRSDLAIPLVTGPNNGGLSVRVRDAATKEVLAQMAPPSIRVQWWAWRPEVAQGKELDVEIVVEDKGTGWGQWIAIGWPHVMKQ